MDHSFERPGTEASSNPPWLTVFEHAGWGIRIGSADGRTVLAVNRAFAALHGYTQDELVQRPIEDLYAPECLSDAIVRLREATGGRQVFESVHLRKDGSRIPVLVDATPFTGSDGHVYQAVNVLDLSELKRAQGAHQEVEARYRVVAEAASDAIVTIDLHSTVLFANPALHRVFGYVPDEVVGQSLTMLMPEYLRRVHEAGIGRYLETGVRHLDWHAVEVPGRHKNGHEIPLEVSFGEAGKGDRKTFTGVIRDITARKRTEEHHRHVQRMESIGRLAGGIAHEVNNQMTIVLGAVDFLNQRTDLPDAVREEVEHVRRAGERSAAITSQLLAFGRRQMLQPEIVSLNQLIEEFEPILQRSLGPAGVVRLNLSPIAGHLRVDRGQMEQVLLNLALNAAHAMGPGGVLAIETDRVTITDTHDRTRPGEYAVVRVCDSGHGMSAATLGRVFEPFFSTKEAGEGSGLGLSTAYGIIKQSDGYIWAESQLGRGTTMTIQLPGVEQGPSPPRGCAEASSAGGHETVLVVDDDPMVRQMVVRSLRQGGYRCLEAANGRDALRAVEQHSKEISLVVSDVAMAEMSGRDLAVRLRESQPGLPILFISGYPDNDVIRRGLLDAGGPFLQKPFSPELLASKVRQLLDHHNPAGMAAPLSSDPAASE